MRWGSAKAHGRYLDVHSYAHFSSSSVNEPAFVDFGYRVEEVGRNQGVALGIVIKADVVVVVHNGEQLAGLPRVHHSQCGGCVSPNELSAVTRRSQKQCARVCKR